MAKAPSPEAGPGDPPAAGLGRAVTFSYALGSVGTAGFSTVPGLLLAYYLTDSLGVAAGVAALVLLLPKLWDVVFLPLVGNLSDRSVAVRRSRRPFLLAGGLLLPVLFALMFAAPVSLSPTAAAVWVFAFFVASASAFALFQVPYIAMPAEITGSPRERTTLMAWRVAFLTFGILLFGAGAPALRDAFTNETVGYATMGVVVGALIGLGMLGCWWGLRRVRALRVEESEHSLRAQFAVVRRNRDFLTLLGTFVLQALATGAMLAAAQYFATYELDRERLSDVLFACLVAPGILFMPVWAAVSHSLGKKRGYQVASALFIAGALALVGARSMPLALVLALVGVCGIGYAGMQMFPLSMLPDTIAADTAARGRQQAGAFTGYWTAGETAGMAIGPAAVLAVLGATGFVSTRGNEVAVQPASAVTGVLLAFTVVPAALVAVSLLLLRLHNAAHDAHDAPADSPAAVAG